VKIAYLINQYPQASQSFIRREIRALEAQGFQIDRFTLRTWDQKLVDPDDQAEKEKTRVVLDVGAFRLFKALLFTFFTRPAHFFRGLRLAFQLGKAGERGRIYHLIYLAEACVLLGWLAKAGSQHLHAHFGTNSAAVVMLVRELGGPPYSFTCHGPEEFDRPLTLKLREKIAAARFVVAVSSYGRSQLLRWANPADWPRIHVVHCGLDASFLQASTTPLPDVPRLLCIGRLAEQKGQLLLIEAAARLRAQNVPFELALAGDGPLRREVETLIGRHDLASHITITGWLSNSQVREQILAARAVILPSFAEGLPVVLMEAMALQRPVISTFVAGIPELVESGKSGYLIPAGCVNSLAEAMKTVLAEDVEHLRAMGRHGARQVALQHDANHEAQKLVLLFQQAAKDAEKYSPAR
jgi:glycosyltransferase involved in cell wall biosynthesis